MDVVETNISGEPLQQFGQLEIRGAFDRGLEIIPFLTSAPIGVFELMLYIEEIDASRKCQQVHRSCDHHHRRDRNRILGQENLEDWACPFRRLLAYLNCAPCDLDV